MGGTGGWDRLHGHARRAKVLISGGHGICAQNWHFAELSELWWNTWETGMEVSHIQATCALDIKEEMHLVSGSCGHRAGAREGPGGWSIVRCGGMIV